MRKSIVRHVLRGHRSKLVWLLCLSALVGCNATTPSGAPGTGSPVASVAAAPSRLVLALPSEPDSLNVPQIANVPIRAWVSPSAAEGLAIRNSQTGEFEPLLAESWAWVDDTTLRVSLRPNVKFHNGDTLSADDVVATVAAAQVEPALLKAGYFPNLVSARAVDDLTVDLIQAKADPSLIPRLAFLRIEPKEFLASGNVDSEIVGTGPYKFVSWDRGRAIILERFDGYWGTNAAPWQEVQFVFRGEASVRASMVKASEAHVAIQLTPATVEGIESVVTAPAPEVLGFILNSRGQKAGGSPLEDVRVRQAIQYAVDKESIVANIYGGYGLVPNGQFNQPGTLGLDPALKDYPYDPDKARELVAEAGAEGQALEMYVPTSSPWNNIESMSQAVGAMIEESGLVVNIHQIDWRSNWVPIFQAAHNGTDPIPADMMAFGHSNEFWEGAMRSATYFQSQERGGGFFQDNDPVLDDLLEAAKTAIEVEDRTSRMQAAWRHIHEQALALPIIAPLTINAVGAHVTWAPRPDALIIATEIGWSN